MFNFLKSLIQEANIPENTGALVSHDEAPVVIADIVGKANAVDWKSKTTYRSFPAFNQKRSNECGAFSGKKHMGIKYSLKYGNFIEFSEEDIYQRRYNKGSAGMYLPDLMNILKSGPTLKILTNVDNVTDADADNCKIEAWKRDVGKIFASDQEIYIPAGDFDTIASVIQTTGKSVISLMFFMADEWAASIPQYKYPSLRWDGFSTLRHFINIVDYVYINNQELLVVEDSAWFGGLNTRFLTREFFQARNTPVPMANAYLMNFKFEQGIDKPTYNGSTIISAQECLRSEGLFPSNIAFAENIGPITRTALINFQKKYGLPQSAIIDESTKAKLHQLYP